MTLEDILEPVSNAILAEATRLLPSTLARSILPIIPGLTSIAEAELLLLGVYAEPNNQGWSPNEVRKSLYQLFSPHGLGRVADLGNISNLLSADEQTKALEYIAEYCAREKKILVVFSPNQNHTLPLYIGLNNSHKDLGITIIDSSIDMGTMLGDKPTPQYISSILENAADTPKFISVIGIQSYLTNPMNVDLSSKMYLELLRLGELRADLKAAEPIIRDANLVSFDMTAIRYADNPECIAAGPNGLYAEEACLLARYAGFADKVDLFAVFGDFLPSSQNISTQLAAQLLWHFLDGFANRKHEYPLTNSKKLEKYIVKLGKDDEELVFYKSKKTDRWWMEIDSTKNNSSLVSCRYEDYQEACQQDIPYRWLFYYKKWN